jgi:hypothetical protein
MFLPGTSTESDRRYDVWIEIVDAVIIVDPASNVYGILDIMIA